MNRITVFGGAVRDYQDTILKERDRYTDDISMVRTRLFSDESISSLGNASPRRWSRLGIGALASGVAMVVLGWLVWPGATDGMNKHSGTHFRIDNWVQAAAGETREIAFDDGSVVRLEGGSGRIVSQQKRRVRYVLERGTATVQVVHHSDTQWVVSVGPYQVNVVGTVFEVTWRPESQYFRLVLWEGAVDLYGPMIEAGRKINSAERFEAWITDGRVSISSLEKEGTRKDSDGSVSVDGGDRTANDKAAARPPVVESDDPGGRTGRGDSVVVKKTVTAPDDHVLSWSAMNKNGQFQEVVSQAEAEGFAHVWTARPVEDILALADAARLVQRLPVSMEAYQWIRKRFGGTVYASNAAFELGRMTLDRHRDYEGAASWLELYLNERPTGPFAREALGRLMESRQQMGDGAGAAAAAHRYLESFPDGPHGELARTLIFVKH